MSKFSLSTAALAAILCAAPAFAEEGNVPTSALAALGLVDMQEMSDVQGDHVRGTNKAVAGAVTAVSGVLFDPQTKNFVNFGEADFAMTHADAMDAQAAAVVGFSLDLALVVDTDGDNVPNFVGRVTGSKLGFGFSAVNDAVQDLHHMIYTPMAY